MTTTVLRTYWRRTLALTLALLALWLALTLVAAELAPALTLPLDGWPSFGYWLLAQGAVLGYLALTIVYAVAMNWRDARQRVPADPS